MYKTEQKLQLGEEASPEVDAGSGLLLTIANLQTIMSTISISHLYQHTRSRHIGFL